MVEELSYKAHKKVKTERSPGPPRKGSSRDAPADEIRVGAKGGGGPADHARSDLPPLVAQYFTQVRAMLARNPAAFELHQLRLATKRLRYSLELFRACYGRGLETRLDQLRDVQQLLGEVNDSVATGRLVGGTSANPERARALQFLEQRAAHKAAEFRKLWMDVFDAPGRERWWTTYLQRQAHHPVGHGH